MNRDQRIIFSVSQQEKEKFQRAADLRHAPTGENMSLSVFLRIAAHQFADQILEELE
jgi:hypothetical protein